MPKFTIEREVFLRSLVIDCFVTIEMEMSIKPLDDTERKTKELELANNYLESYQLEKEEKEFIIKRLFNNSRFNQK